MMSGDPSAGWVMLVDILLMMGGVSSTAWLMLVSYSLDDGW